MSGITTLALLTILAIVVVRWLTRRLRLPTPAAFGIAVVFVLVVLAMWGQHFRH